MKVLDISHLIDGVDGAEEDLESFYGQIENVQRSIRDFRSLDEALKGATGEAMRSYFDQVHLPFLTLLHQSMIEYKATLSKMRMDTRMFDINWDGFVNQCFLAQEVEEGLDNVKKKAIDLTDEANNTIRGVQDLVSIKSIDASDLVDNVRDGKERVETVVDDLKTLDDEKTSLLEKTKNDIRTMKTYLSDLEIMLNKGDVSIKNFSFESVEGLDSYQSLMGAFTSEEGSDQVGFASLFNKMVDGKNLTAEERDQVYNYIQNVVINNDSRKDMDELIGMINEDTANDELRDRMNSDVLTSENALRREMAIIQAYLYNGNTNPIDHNIHDLVEDKSISKSKLNAYLAVLENYTTAIDEVKEGMNWEEGSDAPLLARAEYLNYIESDKPYTLSFNTDVTIMLHQDGIPREEFLDLDEPLVVRKNESEVTYFLGKLATTQLQNSNNEDLEEEVANYTANFIGEEFLGLLIGNAGRATIPLAIADVGARYQEGIDENTKRLEMGEVKSVAVPLKMQIQISDRFKPGSGNRDYNIETIPTNSTFNLLSRWEEVHKINPDIPYPVKEIEDQDWEKIANYLSGKDSAFTEINPYLSDYINNNEIEGEGNEKIEDIAK